MSEKIDSLRRKLSGVSLSIAEYVITLDKVFARKSLEEMDSEELDLLGTYLDIESRNVTNRESLVADLDSLVSSIREVRHE